MAKDGVMIIDDSPIEKFGIHMENISGIRTTHSRIGMGYVTFLACVFLPEMTIPISSAESQISQHWSLLPSQIRMGVGYCGMWQQTQSRSILAGDKQSGSQWTVVNQALLQEMEDRDSDKGHQTKPWFT